MTALSPYNNLLRLSFPIILLIVGIFILIATFKNSSLNGIIILSVVGIGFWGTKWKYDRIENLFYDTDFLYLKNRQGEKKIKLQDISRITPTSSRMRIMGFQFYKYKIDFKSGPMQIDTVSFWASGINDTISKFETHIAAHNLETNKNHPASSSRGYYKN